MTTSPKASAEQPPAKLGIVPRLVRLTLLRLMSLLAWYALLWHAVNVSHWIGLLCVWSRAHFNSGKTVTPVSLMRTLIRLCVCLRVTSVATLRVALASMLKVASFSKASRKGHSVSVCVGSASCTAINLPRGRVLGQWYYWSTPVARPIKIPAKMCFEFHIQKPR